MRPSTRTTTRRAPGAAVPLTIPYQASRAVGWATTGGGGGAATTVTQEP